MASPEPAVPWPSPPLLVASIATNKGSPRSARMRRARRHPCLRRRRYRRRASPPSLSPPLAVSLSRGTRLSAAEAEAGAQRGLRRVLGHASALRGPSFLRAGPTAAVIYFLICFALLFHRFVLIFKNMYLLVGRSKCYGSNFVEFMIMSSI